MVVKEHKKYCKYNMEQLRINSVVVDKHHIGWKYASYGVINSENGEAKFRAMGL